MDTARPGHYAALMDWAVADMAERLSLVERRFDVALAAFGRTPALADAMMTTGRVGRVERLEEEGGWTGAPPERAAARLDALSLQPGTFDAVCAPLSLHHADDLPGALAQLSAALRPDGLLLASLPGPDTFRELREVLLVAESEVRGGAARRTDLFTDLQSAGRLLQRAGLALPVADRDHVTLRYADPDDLVADLRGMAATGPADAPLDRAVWARAKDIYRERFADPDGRLRATFELISMQGWKPHDSQQKPLQPGSAKQSLTEALKPKAD